MELDDLKASWQEKNANYSQLNKKNMEQLQIILKEKTAGVMSSVKKRYEATISYVLTGTVGTLVLVGFVPWLLGVDGPIYNLPTSLNQALNIIVVLLLGLSIVFFYWIKYTSMEQFLDSQDMKSTLSRSIQKLKKSNNQEIFFTVSLTLAWMTIARMHSHFAGYGNFWDILRFDILLSFLVAVALVGYYLVKRTGQYRMLIQELQEYLKEYNESQA